MRAIRVFFTDFWTPFDIHNNIWIDILKTRYAVEVTPHQPDFLFHSCFGHKHITYDCVKMCILGENLTPDFNVSDYAIGFDHMAFEDRYLRVPLYRMYMGEEAYETYSDNFFAEEASSKAKFCNFLYSNSRDADPRREEFFDLLSSYKKVDSGGSFRNNIGGRVDDKRVWQREYKFSIAFENSCKKGYSTEKIYDALCAHTIPIYWGNPTITADFNPKRFINCHDYPSFTAVVERVKELDADSNLYLAMLQEPWFAGKTPLPLPEDPVFTDFFFSIIEQGPEKAKRTTRYGASSVYYKEQRLLHSLEKIHKVLMRGGNGIRKLKRLLQGKA